MLGVRQRPHVGAQGAHALAQQTAPLNNEDDGLRKQDEIMHLGRLLERRQGCFSPGLREGPPEQRGKIQKRTERRKEVEGGECRCSKRFLACGSFVLGVNLRGAGVSARTYATPSKLPSPSR